MNKRLDKVQWVGPESNNRIVVHPWSLTVKGREVMQIKDSQLVFPDAETVEFGSIDIYNLHHEKVGVELTIRIKWKGEKE